jgi:hypothetical protein
LVVVDDESSYQMALNTSYVVVVVVNFFN